MKILIIGGNRFFGKKAAQNLLSMGHQVALLNRQNMNDGLGEAVDRIQCDRKNADQLKHSIGDQQWDVVLDQVCYEAEDARNACKIFRGKTARYIFTSSQSVYGPKGSLVESDFDPDKHHFKEDVQSSKDYAEAKRQCEAVFFSQNDFPVTAIRFPFVVGPDDYTGRLKWHVDRVKSGSPIYFPNIEAQFSLIHSDDAGLILSQIAEKNLQGPLNVCSPEPIKLRELMSEIEELAQRKILLSKEEGDANHSPYGIKNDWFMSAKKLADAGLSARPIGAWISELLHQL